ncbi:MAG: serine/threonine-protein kinase [Acidobacteriota bacterium]
MGPDRPADKTWPRVEALFDRAEALDDSERERFFADCGEPPAIVDEVRALLAADEQATEEAFLAPVARFDGLSDRGPDEVAPGPDAVTGPKRFGPYRTVREIGRGGMSVVYLAERIDGGFEQKVAIKVMAGAARWRGLDRFHRERQILADLNHPHIASLIDGGTGVDGEPYLAMEWIDGSTVDSHCRDRALPVRRRLELLSAVCDAVHAAHRLLIVHRDIKPSNVLVDSEGQVKLVDFGIAALLDGAERAGDALTRTGGRVLTPQYASPEQLLGQPIGVATDVYQLGLLAYEILAGRRPYELAEVAPVEAMRLVVEAEPPPPSASASSLGGSSPAAGAAAGASPKSLEIDGDIDAIVSKALAKRPADRYGSANLLREDIERYLAGLPILARPPTFGYQLRKLVARHRLEFGLAASALVLLVAMAVFFTHRLILERDQTRLQAERAERLLRESEEVTEFLTDLFEVADPNEVGAGDITAREVLERGAAQLERLDGQPLVKARLLNTVGTIYRQMGIYEPSADFFEQAVALRTDAGADPVDLATSLRGLAMTRDFQGLEDEADGLLGEALELLSQEPDHWTVGEAWLHYGTLRTFQRRYDDAAEYLGLAEAALLAAADEPRARSATVQLYTALGRLAEARGEWPAAEAYFAKAVPLHEEFFGPDNLMSAKAMSDLALLRAQLGRFAEAEPVAKRVASVMAEAMGPAHMDTLTAQVNLAIIYKELKRYEESEALYEHILAALDSTPPARGAAMRGQVLANYGGMVSEAGDHVRAEGLLRRAFEALSGIAGPEHPITAITRANLGEALRLQGDRRAEARRELETSLEHLRASNGPDYIALGTPLLNLALLLQDEDPETAERYFRRTVELYGVLDEDAEDRLEAEAALRAFELRSR